MTLATDNLVWVAVLAVGLSMLLRSRGMGTALPLLAVGILIGFLPFGPQAPAAPELIQSVVLAPLVFGEASWCWPSVSWRSPHWSSAG